MGRNFRTLRPLHLLLNPAVVVSGIGQIADIPYSLIFSVMFTILAVLGEYLRNGRLVESSRG
jgi:hypothetical protein